MVDETAPSIEKRRHSVECRRCFKREVCLATPIWVALLQLLALRSLHAALSVAEPLALVATLLLALHAPLCLTLESALHPSLHTRGLPEARGLLKTRRLLHAIAWQLALHLLLTALLETALLTALKLSLRCALRCALLPPLALVLARFCASCTQHFARVLAFLLRDFAVAVGVDPGTQRFGAILLGGGSPCLRAAENDGHQAT